MLKQTGHPAGVPTSLFCPPVAKDYQRSRTTVPSGLRQKSGTSLEHKHCPNADAAGARC